MITDVNVFCGKWPFNEYKSMDAPTLVKHLKANGIERAFVSSLEAVLSSDPDIENEKVYNAIKNFPDIFFLPVIDLSLPSWRDSFEKWAKLCPTVKLHPNYHGYDLTSDSFEELMKELGMRNMPVFIQTKIEDPRNQHPLLNVMPVNNEKLFEAVKRFPDVNFVLLSLEAGNIVSACAENPNAFADISFVDGFNSIETLLTKVPESQILFGSHTPVFYTKAALMKLEENGISAENSEKIKNGNIENLMKGSR